MIDKSHPDKIFFRRLMRTKGCRCTFIPSSVITPTALLPGVKWVDDAYQAAQSADLVVLLTEWNEFRALDLKKLAKKMESPRMVDLRNIYSAKEAKRAGFEVYQGVGR